MPTLHLHDELRHSNERVSVQTKYGLVVGGRALNGSAVFLEVPYAQPPKRFEDPIPLSPDYRYESKQFITESSYCAQPLNDGQAAGMPFEDKVGYGGPTENPLFVNIVSPPSFPKKAGLRSVRVYIHGGFLQFGSPHNLSSQAQFIAAEREEVWVNIGYRLSALGFLASDRPLLKGNYGFKDQWLALEWIRDNITAFGGDPRDIQVTGLSAGAHSVHQHLHHVTLLPEGVDAPFQTVVLQSNAMLINPKTLDELRPQYDTLCRALGLDPEADDTLSILKDPSKVPWKRITSLAEDGTLFEYGTFRGCLSSDWIRTSPPPMEVQRSGDLGKMILEKGVKVVVLGDLSEEWYLYSIAHPILSKEDILPNLERYFPRGVALDLMDAFPPLKDGATAEESAKSYGEIMACAQVHLPVRRLAQDIATAGVLVLRYELHWTPEPVRPFGYVTHGSDRVVWTCRLQDLENEDRNIIKAWLERFGQEVAGLRAVEPHGATQDVEKVLMLGKRGGIEWAKDSRLQEIRRIEAHLSK